MIFLRYLSCFGLFCFTAFGMDDVKITSSYSASSYHRYETIFDHDFHQSIEKLCQSNWTISNKTDESVEIIVKGVYKLRDFGKVIPEVIPFQEVCIGAHETYKTDSKELSKRIGGGKKIVIQDVQFKGRNIPFFLNLETTSKGYEIVIQKEFIPAFPQIGIFRDFTPQTLPDSTLDTAPKPIVVSDSSHSPYGNTPAESSSYNCPFVKSLTGINQNKLSLMEAPLELGFIKQYNAHLRYLFNVQFAQEKINKDSFFQKLNDVYQKNSLEKTFFSKELSKETEGVQIPAITHTLWFTSDDNPTEFPERYLYWLKKSIEACPASQGFTHYFWMHDKSKLPLTVKALAKLNVTVRESRELGEFRLKALYDYEFQNKRFGRLSDIFRLVVLDQFGGVYKDTDYRIHQSLLPLLHNYHFVAGREPMSSFICNALVAACPGHPVIKKTMELIQRNYDLERSPRYIKNIKDEDGFKTILLTGPGVFLTGVAHGLDQEGYKDIILPHPYLYPTQVEVYPQKWPVKFYESVPLAAYGVHYWETSWAKTRSKEFGSFG